MRRPPTTSSMPSTCSSRPRRPTRCVLFIAGHGIQRRRRLSLPGHQRGAGRRGFRGATVVPWQVLQEAVEAAKGRRMLFLDTCHSGNAYNQKLGNAAYHANIIAYTAARFDQEAMEDATLGHGLFTYAVVRGPGRQGRVAPSARSRPRSWPTTWSSGSTSWPRPCAASRSRNTSRAATPRTTCWPGGRGANESEQVSALAVWRLRADAFRIAIRCHGRACPDHPSIRLLRSLRMAGSSGQARG